MKIVYLVGSGVFSSGYRVVFEQINGLIERGHDVQVLSSSGEQPDWFELKTDILKVPHLRWIPEADIIVATVASTAAPASRARFGIPFYLVQGYETAYTKERQIQQLCERSYKLPLNILCIAGWLRDFLKKKFKREAHVIPIGIDHHLFKPTKKVSLTLSNKKKILMMCSKDPFKGTQDGLEAFRLIREKLEGEVELIMFGLISPPLTDFPYTYYYKPPREKLSEIYSSCDVFMATTWFEGCPMSPLEAMACKTPVVTPNSLGVMEYARDGKTVLLTERRNPAKLAEGVIKLLKDTSLRKKIMEGGYIISKEFTWERMVKELEILFSRAEKIYKRKAPQEWSPWEKVTSISQGDVWAHFKLGVSLYKLSRLEEAKKEFEFVIGENYKHPDAYKYLGKTLAKLGNLRGALLNLRKAKELLMKSR